MCPDCTRLKHRLELAEGFHVDIWNTGDTVKKRLDRLEENSNEMEKISESYRKSK